MRKFKSISSGCLDIKFIKELGSGSFGTVYKVIDNETREYFAIKCIPKHGNSVPREYKILKMLIGCTYIIELVNIFFTVHTDEKIIQHLVLEYMPKSLSMFLKKLQFSNTPLSTDDKKKIIFQVLKGLKEIHANNIMHRDIKPENLLIDPETLKLKICDFGSAKIVGENHNIPLVVSRPYRAPELALANTEYGTEVDIWSAGCVLFELFTNEPLFKVKKESDQLIKQIQILGPIPESSPLFTNSRLPKDLLRKLNLLPRSKPLKEYFEDEFLIDLLTNMLNYDQQVRYTASQCLSHPFFSNIIL